MESGKKQKPIVIRWYAISCDGDTLSGNYCAACASEFPPDVLVPIDDPNQHECTGCGKRTNPNQKLE